MAQRGDAFGLALRDWSRGGTDPEVYERDDGFVDVGAGPDLFMAGPRFWPAAERRAMRYVRGTVADLGCGGGRVALHLQDRGFDVTGVDASALALRVARDQGLKRTEHVTLSAFAGHVAIFDTVVLFGNNLGMFATPERLRRTLRQWAAVAAPGTRILAESTRPASGHAPGLDGDYMARNRRLGRPPGQVRLRVRYRQWASPWFDWLFVAPADMRAIVEGTGWDVRAVVEPEAGGPYVALWEHARRSSPRPVRD
ncbi:MAG TPA: class I SAM-dependent methyltransferase [Acidimicrobiales bacterium]|nr:class I SAM-dependent methyltransferase [Acidimicrobiales bacterium]